MSRIAVIAIGSKIESEELMFRDGPNGENNGAQKPAWMAVEAEDWRRLRRVWAEKAAAEKAAATTMRASPAPATGKPTEKKEWSDGSGRKRRIYDHAHFGCHQRRK